MKSIQINDDLHKRLRKFCAENDTQIQKTAEGFISACLALSEGKGKNESIMCM